MSDRWAQCIKGAPGWYFDTPAFDRESLGWGAEIEGKELLFRYGKRGYDYWYQATIGAYDGNNKHHEILPTDGTPKLDVDC